MDIGIFKASKTRLALWIIVPPLLITSVGLSAFTFQQRAEWRLKETEALSNILPDVVQSRANVQGLFDELGMSEGKRITSGDQLTTILEENARKRNVDVKRTQILEGEKRKGSKIPMISLMLEARGEFADFQLFLNDVKSAHPLISVRSINVGQSREPTVESGFELKVVFDLLLVNDVMKATGGIK